MASVSRPNSRDLLELGLQARQDGDAKGALGQILAQADGGSLPAPRCRLLLGDEGDAPGFGIEGREPAALAAMVAELAQQVRDGADPLPAKQLLKRPSADPHANTRAPQEGTE